MCKPTLRRQDHAAPLTGKIAKKNNFKSENWGRFSQGVRQIKHIKDVHNRRLETLLDGAGRFLLSKKCYFFTNLKFGGKKSVKLENEVNIVRIKLYNTSSFPLVYSS